MTELCAFCGNENPLHKSHIIPAFVFKWLKDTSGGTYLRYGENPNRRVQDGLKIPLLCTECEALFNKWETIFANKIFHPYNLDTSLKLTYGDWYAKFCTSVSWRVLAYHIRRGLFEKINEERQVEIRNAFATWQSFLRGDCANPGKFEQHVLPVDALQDIPHPDTPKNINRFLLRSVELDFVQTSDIAMTYAKMGKFVLFGYIIPPREKWKGTKISVSHGRFEPKKYTLPFQIMDFLFDRARNNEKLLNGLSARQTEKIDQNVMDNIDAFADSELFKAMLEDSRLFGEDAVLRKPKSGDGE